ncbi:hypothetical protein GS490_11215 [Rhodococcus hoagii]|uniref:hypothetical protein n=1 Tax=Rhodococcus hoagii TaxID=43767 RepID=UPI001A04AE4D|nr:hypothetical protein [Prescottella equi]NKS16889.1 hypothetical protein [Prescottella equi]BCN58376.1 hypothetical protein RE9427_17460 [Prescottella equi]
MSLFVDSDALDGIATSLAAAGTDIDSVAATVPPAVEAGDATAALLGILAQLTENAAQLVDALTTASAAVAQANASYREQDVASADSTIAAWAE